MWDQSPASFASETVSFDAIFCEPRPRQPRLPVWFGGRLHPRNLRRIVELGDGWIPIMGASVDDVRDGVHRLRDALSAAGRSPEDLGIRATPDTRRDAAGGAHLAATVAGAPELIDAGATDVHLNLRAFDPALDDPAATLTRMVECFRAEVG